MAEFGVRSGSLTPWSNRCLPFSAGSSCWLVSYDRASGQRLTCHGDGRTGKGRELFLLVAVGALEWMCLLGLV